MNEIEKHSCIILIVSLSIIIIENNKSPNDTIFSVHQMIEYKVFKESFTCLNYLYYLYIKNYKNIIKKL